MASKAENLKRLKECTGLQHGICAGKRGVQSQALSVRPLTVGEIVAATSATQSNISKHLSLLASAGAITRRKDAQFVYYRVSRPLTLKLCELVHKELLNQW